MNIKTIFITFLFTLLSFSAFATEWVHDYYKFQYFTYSTHRLFSFSMDESDIKLEDDFEMACKINAYIKKKIENGELKDKPVEYKLKAYMADTTGCLLEVYEGKKAYYIIVNNPFSAQHEMGFTFAELIGIIDYMASPSFKPVFYDKTNRNTHLMRRVLAKYLKPITSEADFKNKEIELFRVDSMTVKYYQGKYNVFWGDEDLKIQLQSPIAIPFRFNDRYVLMDEDRVFVFEHGRKVKQVNTQYLLNEGEYCTNVPNLGIYPQWINFHNAFDTDKNNPSYSYSYQKNKLIKLEED